MTTLTAEQISQLPSKPRGIGEWSILINNGYYPEISNPRITVLNTSIATFTGQRPVTETLNVSKSYVHGVTRAQINSDAFGLRIAYPKNTATTPLVHFLVELQRVIKQEMGIIISN